MSAQRGPAGLIRLNGSLVVRRAGWLDSLAQPECPFGHPLKEHAKLLEGRGVYWCKFRAQRTEAECGALIYILRVPTIGQYCADVTSEEMRHMEQEQMTAWQVFNYLGVHFPAGSLARAKEVA